MKPTLTLFLILFLFVGSSSAQTKENVLNYYKTINLAELAICDSNFTEASKHYKEAFTINKDKPFSKDLLNAFHAAMDTREYPLAETYMARILSRGIGNQFINNTLYENYSGEQLQQLKAMISKYPNKDCSKKPLVVELNKMIAWDQAVRMHFGELYNGEYMVDSTYHTDYINGTKLLKMFTEKGVPNEDVIGNGERTNPTPGTQPDYTIIIHHCMVASERFPHIALDTVLYDAINTFDFDARIFPMNIHANTILGSFRYRDLTLNFPLLLDGAMYERKFYTDYWDETSERAIDAERAKIGLEPLDDFRRKIVTHNRGKLDILGKYTLGGNFTVKDISTEEGMRIYLSNNRKETLKKNSLAGKRKRQAANKIDYGQVYDRFIGKTNLDSILIKYGNGGWLKRPIPFQNWTNRKAPLKWGEHAEIVRNTKANIGTDTGRYNQARFLPGYRIYASFWPYDGGSASFLNEESIFENNLLINFTADVDSGFYRYKGVVRALGKPVLTQKSDTLKDGSNRILKTKIYTWQKGNNRTRHTISEYYNLAGEKKVNSVYEMTDIKKYTAYMEKVEAEKKRLEKQYLAEKKL